MATTATLYRIQLELSDIDRGVYESLDLRVAQHPSEDLERMTVRLLARAMAHEEGLDFGRGLSNADDAALWTHSPMGEVQTWIDVGVPGAERLHRANKRVDKLLVFTHKRETALRKEWSTRKIHRAEDIVVYRLPPKFIRELSEALTRKMDLFVTIHEELLTVAAGACNLECAVEKVTLASLSSAKG